MSFQRSSNLEAQPTTFRREDDPQYSDDPEFRVFTTDLSDKLFSLTSKINQLTKQVSLLGTKRETDRVRERIQDLIEETGTSFKDIGEGLKKLTTWHDLGVYLPPLYVTPSAEPIQSKADLRVGTMIAPTTLHAGQTQPGIQSLPRPIPTPPTPSPRKAASLCDGCAHGSCRRLFPKRCCPIVITTTRRFSAAIATTRTAPPSASIRSRLPGISHHRARIRNSADRAVRRGT